MSMEYVAILFGAIREKLNFSLNQHSNQLDRLKLLSNYENEGTELLNYLRQLKSEQEMKGDQQNE